MVDPPRFGDPTYFQKSCESPSHSLVKQPFLCKYVLHHPTESTIKK